MPDLPAALAELEKTVAAQINTVTDPVAAQIRAHLALYQEPKLTASAMIDAHARNAVRFTFSSYSTTEVLQILIC
jgi:hypothetical protein